MALSVILQAVGALGIFILGMLIMTDGLHALAQMRLQSLLIRLSKTPLSGALTGALTTAILQSSSATTVAAVGFVSAGILHFSQALGIIFGANIGTTITGWLVALFGFKLPLGVLAYPIIFIGVSLRLFSSGKLRNLGLALAGFGLIFVGISMLQESMSAFKDLVTPQTFPPDTWLGRIELVGIGILFTLITQSSSAGVAMALTALYAGTISFEQAAAMVIGMDVGTTVTAVMATIGGSVEAKRTGLSHVIYNLFTGAGALLLLSPYIWMLHHFFPELLAHDPEIALVGFHTLFNTIGVIVILPFTSLFAKAMLWLIPAYEPPEIRGLDKSLLSQPQLALKAVLPAIIRTFITLLEYFERRIKNLPLRRNDPYLLEDAIEKLEAYVDEIELSGQSQQSWQTLVHTIHILDHMHRLYDRLFDKPEILAHCKNNPDIQSYIDRLEHALRNIRVMLKEKQSYLAKKEAQNLQKEIEKFAGRYRQQIASQIASGKIDVPAGKQKLEQVRFLTRAITHVARITYHLENMELEKGTYRA